ncbi:hypothetical protein [Methylotenera sp.]|uniref:hypothetical protein n=1 Tax=Methylotenera sp. TaxID=2051956 RepID=UPI00248A3A2E|nr:hypothetical protein [Methylotenera sp.]MDI1362690.1 hypothetical protein [Methylotenera sp.]
MTEIEPARLIGKIEKTLELTSEFDIPESGFLVGIKLSICYLGYDGDKAENIIPQINISELSGKSRWVIKQWQLQQFASDCENRNEVTDLLNQMETYEEVSAWIKQEPWRTQENCNASDCFDQALIGLYSSKYANMFINNTEDESAILIKNFYGE